jgi:DNA-binding transcriptional LysR family regulator
MIDFEWYRSFVAIYQAGTVTRAAQLRTITQPALSQHLAALEAALGTPLFLRTPRRMVPTARGQALYTQVAPAVEQLEQIETLRQAATTPPALRLGGPRDYLATIGLARLRRTALHLTVQFGVARTLVEQVQHGVLDAAIASERITSPSLIYQPLMQEDFVIVGACGLIPPAVDPATPHGRIALADWLITLPWLSYGPDLPLIRRLWRQCFGRRPALTPVLILPDLLLLVDALTSGPGVSVLPRYLCQAALDANRLSLLWDPDPPVTNRLWLVCQKVQQQHPGIQQVYAALRGHTGVEGE